jgi:tetratricopeptide (TPR) repeat protein
MIKNYIISALAVIFSLTPAYSQWQIMSREADSLVTLGADYIYNVEFDRAEKTFNQVIDLYPAHPSGYFLKSMIWWWQMQLVGPREVLQERFLEDIDKVIDVCDEILDTNAYDLTGLFFKGGALGYRGRYYGQQKAWYDAASDGSAALEIMERAYKAAPTNYDIMLGKGVYSYFAAAIPEKYPIVEPFLAFFPPGDKDIGLIQLKTAANKARYANVEGMVTLMQVYYNFERDYDNAYIWAKRLYDMYPGNGYFHRYIARIYVKRGNWKMVEEEWRDILVMALDRKTGYNNLMAREACYYIGSALMRKGEYDLAIRYLEKVDEVSVYMDEDDSSYKSQAHLKMAQMYMAQGNEKEAIKQYREVLDTEDFANSHEKARKALERLR